MPRKKKPPMTLFERLQHIKHSGLEGSKTLFTPARETHDELIPFDERTNYILGITNNPKRKPTNMLFFVMCDIEDNKVRYQILLYLR